MKIKLLKLLFICLFTSLSLTPRPVQAEVGPRAMALGSMAVYGAIGGALLGTATLAFDGGGRNIAKGASLGLYAGLLFGGYVVITHQMRRRKMNAPQEEPEEDNYYPDTDEDDSPYEEGSGSIDRVNSTVARWDAYWEVEGSHLKSRGQKYDLQIDTAKNKPEFYINLVNIQF